MNDGKDVVTLMREITLPPDLDLGESYGRLTWSIRGIYEGYVGWFDGNVSTMFGPASQAYGEIVRLAGGPDAVAARALEIAGNDPLGALYLTDMALAVDSRHRASLEARIKALKTLDAQSGQQQRTRVARGWDQRGRDKAAPVKGSKVTKGTKVTKDAKVHEARRSRSNTKVAKVHEARGARRTAFVPLVPSRLFVSFVTFVPFATFDP